MRVGWYPFVSVCVSRGMPARFPMLAPLLSTIGLAGDGARKRTATCTQLYPYTGRGSGQAPVSLDLDVFLPGPPHRPFSDQINSLSKRFLSTWNLLSQPFHRHAHFSLRSPAPLEAQHHPMPVAHV